jgi:hypothetical protein
MKSQIMKSLSVLKKYSLNIILSLFCVALSYTAFSYIKPESPYSFKGVFGTKKEADNNHDSGEDFLLNGLAFNIEGQYQAIIYSEQDCSKNYTEREIKDLQHKRFSETGILEWFGNSRETCVKSNEEHKKLSDTKKYLVIKFKIKNGSNAAERFSNDWFKLVTSNGDTIEYGNHETDLRLNFFDGDVLPNTTREGSSEKILIDINDNNSLLVITMPGYPEQTVKLNAR